jgi:hypothetical protein
MATCKGVIDLRLRFDPEALFRMEDLMGKGSQYVIINVLLASIQLLSDNINPILSNNVVERKIMVLILR